MTANACKNRTMPRALLLLVLVATAFPALAAPPRTSTDLRCESSGASTTLLCILTVKTPDNAPVKGASVTLGATMPSDPKAPVVRPATATTGLQPNEYRGVLELGAPGTWTIMVDIAGPVADRFARDVKVDACAANKRCPAAVLDDPRAARKK